MSYFSQSRIIIRSKNNKYTADKTLEEELHNEPPEKGLVSDFNTSEYLDVLEKIFHEVLRDKV